MDPFIFQPHSFLSASSAISCAWASMGFASMSNFVSRCNYPFDTCARMYTTWIPAATPFNALFQRRAKHSEKIMTMDHRQSLSTMLSSRAQSDWDRQGLRRNIKSKVSIGIRKIHKRSSLSSNGQDSIDELSNDEMLSSIQNSLRHDLVQPHLDKIKCLPKSNSSGMPTLILLLAVSGGCDSVALFHSVLSFIKSTSVSKNNFGYDDKTGNHKNTVTPMELKLSPEKSFHTQWLYLGKEPTKKRKTFNEMNYMPEHSNHLFIPCELHVAHFNHEQRDEESDGDETFVRNLCRERRVPFHCFSWSDASLLDDHVKTHLPRDDSVKEENYTESNVIDGNIFQGAFSQEIARKWRQKELRELLASLVQGNSSNTSAEEIPLRWGAILTAHHRDDADETIILKLLRGSHMTNLRGMEARSDEFDLCQNLDGYAEERYGNTNEDVPTGSYFTGYFAKPMLGVRKSSVVRYLASNNFAWREDASNKSSKYKRNMVRNELMPLLREIAGGERALQKRLSHLELQSRDISRDLYYRAKAYLSSMPSKSLFFLPQSSLGSTMAFDIVQEQALHLWITNVTNGEFQIPYDKLLTLKNQIQFYPERIQWTMDVGGFWKIRRNGYVLSIVKGWAEDMGSCAEIPMCLNNSDSWTVIRAECESDTSIADDCLDKGPLNTVTLCLNMPPLSPKNETTLVVDRVRKRSNMTFIPPWRKGGHAVKVRKFLRGQKVPLHMRDEASLLCFSDDSEERAIAIHVEETSNNSTGRWIVHADFANNDMPTTKIVLARLKAE